MFERFEQFERGLTLNDARTQLLIELVDEQCLRFATLNKSLKNYISAFFNQLDSQVDQFTNVNSNLDDKTETKVYMIWGLEMLSKEIYTFSDDFIERKQCIENLKLDESTRLFDPLVISKSIDGIYNDYQSQLVADDTDLLTKFDTDIRDLLLEETFEKVRQFDSELFK